MATLYVENVPKELHEGLRKRAKSSRRSMAAEVISILEDVIPTRAELKKREEFFRQVQRLKKRKPVSAVPFPTTDDILRGDRER